MGGKTWSRDEERLFWEVIVPQSAAAAYPDDDGCLSWEQLADEMNKLSGANARRVYTGTMLYEHHYQNIKPGHRSPKAAEFVDKYLQDAAYFKEHGSRRPSTPSNDSASASEPLDPQIVELLQDKAKPKPKTRRQRKARHPWERQGEDQPSRPFFSMPKTLEEIGAYSVTPGNAAQQQPPEGYATPDRADTRSRPYPFPKSALVSVPGSGSVSVWSRPIDRSEIDRSQMSERPAMAFERTPKPSSGFLKQPADVKMEGGYWHSTYRAEQDQRSKEAMYMTSGSTSAQSPQPPTPDYASSWADPGPSRQRTHQEQWDGRLPSIREMLPHEFGTPAYDSYHPHEVNRRVDKRNFSNEQGHMQAPDSTPKRRRLPDAPVRRQHDEQQQPRRYD
ncbi:hypothetical protein HYE68_010211 [Fusarium pseudograminearum]|nr:hypothetical protein HYE68_010211 [Fusarium pseudograminearum]